jgi:hypothetical protein
MIGALLRFGLWLSLLMTACIAQAHESRPAYLEVNELTPGRYTVLWRTPTNAGMRLPVRLELPAGVRDLSPPAVRELSDSRIERRMIESPDGLTGKRIVFVGLQGTITDVLVRIQLANGTQTNVLIHPSNAWVEIPRAPGPFTVAKTYAALGIEHILTGFDHLCFVLGLVLLVGFNRRLFWTVTAFTVAHSITLVLATLGIIHVAGPPVEATIALSIVFVASALPARSSKSSAAVKAWCRGSHGWWRSRSGCCTDLDSPARWPRSGCRPTQSRSLCCSSISGSKSANCCSSPPCSPQLDCCSSRQRRAEWNYAEPPSSLPI